MSADSLKKFRLPPRRDSQRANKTRTLMRRRQRRLKLHLTPLPEGGYLLTTTRYEQTESHYDG